MGGEVTLKLPFTLMRNCNDIDLTIETILPEAPLSPPVKTIDDFELKKQPIEDLSIDPEKDDT